MYSTAIVNIKKLFWIWILVILSLLLCQIFAIYYVDPFFVYHKPYTDQFFYILDNEKSQNYGIIKQFDYDALSTGSSMTELFKTSEIDQLFGVHSVKVSSAGASYMDSGNIVSYALQHHPKIKLVVRGLDLQYIFQDSDYSNTAPLPTYLYDENRLNDIQYLLNRDIFWGRVAPMIVDGTFRHQHGITSFDNYSYWQKQASFGKNIFNSGYWNNTEKYNESKYLTNEERDSIIRTVNKNIVSIAKQYPETEFLLFIPPYGIIWWNQMYISGNLPRYSEAMDLMTSLLIQNSNIKLYSFFPCTDIITNLNFYLDPIHYGSWINSFILRAMSKDEYRLTRDNYRKITKDFVKFIENYQMTEINKQEDLEDDEQACQLMNELYGQYGNYCNE